MQCPSCGAEVPNDAQFCIECGASLRPAATGATTSLPRWGETLVRCGVCGADNPERATYCVRCGAMLKGAVAIPGPGDTDRLAGPPALPASAPARPWRRSARGDITGLAIMLIGIGVLLLARMPFWPGILFVIGVSSFVSEASRGRIFQGIGSVLWLFGIAILFLVPRLWWPGLLVLIGLSVLLGMIQRSLARP